MMTNQQIDNLMDYQGARLNEDEVKNRIRQFKTIIKGDQDINPNMRQDNMFLLRYLHYSDFHIERAYFKFKKFHNLLMENSKWFDCATPKSYKDQLSSKMRVLLDTRDREGRLIIVAKLANTNVSKTSLLDAMVVDDLVMELGWDDPVTLRKGYCGIMDVKDMSFRLMTWATPANVMFAIRKLDALPLKDMKIHVVNKSRYLDALLAVSWPFMPTKYKQNIFIHHDDWTSLHQHIDPASLPEEYGGTNMKSYDQYISETLGKDHELNQAQNYIKFFVKDKHDKIKINST